MQKKEVIVEAVAVAAVFDATLPFIVKC